MRSYSSRIKQLSCYLSVNYLRLCAWFAFFIWMLGVKAPISESPRQTPARISALHLKSPKPKPFSGKGENPVPMRTFSWSLPFVPWEVTGALGISLEDLWVVSGCGLRAFVPLNTNAEQARSWLEYSALNFDLELLSPLDECGLEPALGIIKAFLFLNEGQLAP